MSKKPVKNKKSFIRCVNELSKPAMILLVTGLHLIFSVALCLIIVIIRDFKSDPLCVFYTYPAMVEYILMSLCIVFIGAAVIDVSYRS